ncbi:MAG: DUF3280 domain-containing protein [Candidatus Thiodiazotropha taylori]|nr:DUF3280 domain-containing protein [Candidatus Thiodiazotropha taylori]MCG7923924.1 DUF3280 domain-containing protein [Candidatus Thiodiazotropha taylori]MCG7993872.1 DUF3280 domain-containing protein [Candidatus Thiodiazotropha taylori]MCW4245774.1 DUF3280 domain-containing protein [Candidatus Thiodiazotropha taylori]MCW4273680.1 DUF3280 domain-containing protein [Candidatus Thiodiazotropha taylori]
MSTSKHCPRQILSILNNQLKLHIALLLALSLLPLTSVAEQLEKLVVLPFEIVDNTPMPGGQERNQKMLDKLTRYIGDSIQQAGLYQVVSQNQVNSAVEDANLGTDIRNCNLCEYDLARQVEGEKVMTGWIYKMSILVLTMHIEIKNVTDERILISKAYDFRGDNEKAWLRAAQYMIRDLRGMMAE